MSLINDLLCELHERKASPPAQMSIHDLRPVRRAPRRRAWLLPVAAVLAASSAWAVFHADVLPVMPRPANEPAARQLADVVRAHVPTPLPATQAEAATVAVFKLTLDHVLAHPVRARVSAKPVVGRATVATPDQPQPPAKVATQELAQRLAKVATPKSAQPSADEATRALPQPPAKVRTPDPTADGLVLLAAGRHAQAEAVFRSVTQSEPASAPAWLHLARALDAQGREGEAQAALTQALGLVSETAPVARALARQLLARGQVQEALSSLIAHRPAHKLNVEHDAFIAALQQRLGQHDMAAERYRTILAVRPEFATWWVGLAISEEARGHGEAAIDAYRHASNIGNLDSRLADYVATRLAAMQGNDAS